MRHTATNERQINIKTKTILKIYSGNGNTSESARLTGYSIKASQCPKNCSLIISEIIKLVIQITECKLRDKRLDLFTVIKLTY